MLNELILIFCIFYTGVSIGIKIGDYIIKILEDKYGKNN